MRQKKHHFMRAMLIIAILFTSFAGVEASTSGLLTETAQTQVNEPSIYVGEGVGKYTVSTNGVVGSKIYCRINSGEWFRYKKPLVFTEYGTYVIEAYSEHDMYAPSDIVSESFTVDEHTGENLVDEDADDPSIIFYDGFKYKINGSTVSLTRQTDKMCSGDLVVPESITHDGVTYPVTEVESWACYGTNNVTSAYIPSTVTEIGTYAFNSCPKLKSITVDEDNPNYCDIDGVLFNKEKTYLLSYPNARATQYDIPDGTVMIHFSAFGEAFDLESVTIPNSVTSIRTSAFSCCFSLKSITLPNNLLRFDWSVFSGCRELKSVTLSPKYNKIPAWTFEGCWELESIVIPSNITAIEDWAFMECYSLKSVTMSEGLKTIAKEAFYRCRALPSITIPSSVSSIGDGVFFQCYKLTDINVAQASNYYCGVDGVLYNKAQTALVAYPVGHSRTSYDILPTTQAISARAFTSANALKRISIPNGVDTIGEYAFAFMENLAHINIPTSLRTIPEDMMLHSHNVKEITIPAGVTSINRSSLACNSMVIVNCLAETPPTIINDNCFSSNTYSNGTLCVPPASLEAYQSAEGWSNFVSAKGFYAGDADGDGELTVNDVTTMIDSLLGSDSSTCFSVNADSNGDGIVSIEDVTALIDKLLGAD